MSASVKSASWKEELLMAFRSLGGAARYNDLYEYIEQTTVRQLTTQWKATVRRTIEDHSSDSMNFRASDLFRHVDHGFWSLREAGDVSSLVNSRLGKTPKAIVKEVLSAKTQVETTNLVFVREHWRQWPSSQVSDSTSFPLDRAVFEVVDAWVTDRYFELKLAKELVLKVPLNWYPSLSSASREEQLDFEFGEYGIHWPQLKFEVLVPEILSKSAKTLLKAQGV
jgi:Protein of unknown function (DUF2442)